MTSCRSAALAVVVLVVALWRDSDFTAASPQSLIFGDPNLPKCNCVLLDRCPSLRFTPGIRLTSKKAAALQRARCGFEGRNIKVCCPDNNPGESPTSTHPTIPVELPTSTRPTITVELPRSCGVATDFNRIHGGEDAPLGAHPWMVALGYKGTTFGGSSSAVLFQCGGVLVTSRYVITAAHCVHPLFVRQQLTQLNMGDWNIATDPDCDSSQSASSKVCAPRAIVRRASRITVHPEYNTNARHNNDIAVIQLDEAVPLGPFVQPICIPESFDPTEHSLPLATGWGKTQSGAVSTILQEVRLPFVDIQLCNASWAGQLGPGQVCAGGVQGKDTCGGDSGGPLVATGKFGGSFKLIGLTSFGRLLCGNKENYGVYTSVAYFRDWILASLSV